MLTSGGEATVDLEGRMADAKKRAFTSAPPKRLRYGLLAFGYALILAAALSLFLGPDGDLLIPVALGYGIGVGLLFAPAWLTRRRSRFMSGLLDEDAPTTE